MAHFEMARWADYVRGLVSPSEQEDMARHLSEGCESCRGLASIVQRIHEDSTAEPAVPEPLVRLAKAVFPAAKTASQPPAWASLPRLVARLVFDSNGSLDLAGARSASDAATQVVYRAGDFSVEVHVEREPQSAELSLAGQVNRTVSAEPLEGVPVLLMANRKVVTSSQSNRFGEFCLAGKAQRGLRLCIHIPPEEKRVEIPLSGVMREGL